MTAPPIARKFPVAELTEFASSLFKAAGMDADKADCVARLLILTDMMGRRTHGLAISPLYLADIKTGGLQVRGEPVVIKDLGATVVWDGGYLPGLWLMNRAINVAIERAKAMGVVTFAIRKSHHIGCLAAHAKQAADQGFVAIIANSDPAGKRVAPYGGTEALFTPDPYAIGYPGPDHPVLVDICASITTVSMTRQKYAAGESFEHPWLLDADGVPTTDPSVLEHSDPRGSLQLLGGQEYGHKGFGMALMIEALSQGLSGYGRADGPKSWGGNTFLQVVNPEFFAGSGAFIEQTDFLSRQCRSNRPVDADKPVRMPGDQAAALQKSALQDGMSYPDAVWQSLAPHAQELGVKLPQ
jgi:LDH2 family malate/lactate/ureidoglycolate dehydrogenase